MDLFNAAHADPDTLLPLVRQHRRSTEKVSETAHLLVIVRFPLECIG